MTGRRQAAEARGRRAETVAALLLRLKGYRILERRFRVSAGEIDLVARRGGLVVFVEVKARDTHAAAAESISPRQQQRISDAAAAWLARHAALADCDTRFDAVFVMPRRWPQHLVDCWRPN